MEAADPPDEFFAMRVCYSIVYLMALFAFPLLQFHWLLPFLQPVAGGVRAAGERSVRRRSNRDTCTPLATQACVLCGIALPFRR